MFIRIGILPSTAAISPSGHQPGWIAKYLSVDNPDRRIGAISIALQMHATKPNRAVGMLIT